MELSRKKVKTINPEYINQNTGQVFLMMRHSPNRFINADTVKNKHMFSEIDGNKAYTYAFINISQVPIYNEFDNWKYFRKKDNIEKLHKLTLYIVKVKKPNLFLNKKICLIFGLFLKYMIEDVEIIYYKEPSFVFDCDYESIVDELYKNKISDDVDEDKHIKKMIANVNFGLMEKCRNKSQQSFVFKNIHEAQYYQGKYGGKLNVIKQETDNEMFIDRYYVLNVSETAVLNNGFRYIKELLLQYHNFNMHQTQQLLKENDIDIYSVKTDAMTILKSDVDKACKLLDIGRNIGQWKINDDFTFPKDNYSVKERKFIKIPMTHKELIEIKDEYDMDDIRSKIEENKKVLIKSKFAGGGKSYIAKHLSEKYKALFVVPTNNLKQECEVEAITINQFFGVGVGEEDRTTAYDHSEYHVIVFDEIYFHNLYFLAKILNFVNTTDKMVVATGDEHQLESVADITNTKDYETYINHCIFKIFPKYIYLKECKRLKTEEDKIKLSSIYDDIFVNKLPKKEIIEKYFPYTEGIDCENNIAYTNETCRTISGQIRHMQGKKDEYELHEILIRRKRIKTKHTLFQVNFRYEIVELHYEDKNDYAILENIKTKERQIITLFNLRNFFIFAYCYTAHSKQGCSVDGDIVIYDWMRSYATLNWLYTAITRARDLNRVKFYQNDVGGEITDYEINQYLNKKIQGYRKQDRDAKRKIDEETYINIEWLRDRMNKSCSNCGEEFLIEKERGSIISNLTAQRLNNSRCHSKDNIKAFCVYCNCSSH